MSDEFSDGVWYVDLAPITNPDLVQTTVARAFGLPDQPGSSADGHRPTVHQRPLDA